MPSAESLSDRRALSRTVRYGLKTIRSTDLGFSRYLVFASVFNFGVSSSWRSGELLQRGEPCRLAVACTAYSVAGQAVFAFVTALATGSKGACSHTLAQCTVGWALSDATDNPSQGQHSCIGEGNQQQEVWRNRTFIPNHKRGIFVTLSCNIEMYYMLPQPVRGGKMEGKIT
jgi:hypothetical protein